MLRPDQGDDEASSPTPTETPSGGALGPAFTETQGGSEVFGLTATETLGDGTLGPVHTEAQ